MADKQVDWSQYTDTPTSNNVDWSQYSDTPPPAKKPGILGGIVDTARVLSRDTVNVAGNVLDSSGFDNAAKTLYSASDSINNIRDQAFLQEDQANAQANAEARKQGILAGIKQGAETALTNPVDTASGLAASTIPSVIGKVIGGGIGSFVAPGLGTVAGASLGSAAGLFLSGMGRQQQNTRDAVQQAALDKGMSDQQAQALAEKQSSLLTGNTLQQLGGGALEVVAVRLGAEKAITPLNRAMGGTAENITGKTALQVIGKPAGIEAGTETIQGAQENIGTNVALKDAGFRNDIADSNTVVDSVVGGIVGGVFGGAAGSARYAGNRFNTQTNVDPNNPNPVDQNNPNPIDPTVNNDSNNPSPVDPATNTDPTVDNNPIIQNNSDQNINPITPVADLVNNNDQNVNPVTDTSTTPITQTIGPTTQEINGETVNIPVEQQQKVTKVDDNTLIVNNPTVGRTETITKDGGALQNALITTNNSNIETSRNDVNTNTSINSNTETPVNNVNTSTSISGNTNTQPITETPKTTQQIGVNDTSTKFTVKYGRDTFNVDEKTSLAGQEIDLNAQKEIQIIENNNNLGFEQKKAETRKVQQKSAALRRDIIAEFATLTNDNAILNKVKPNRAGATTVQKITDNQSVWVRDYAGNIYQTVTNSNGGSLRPHGSVKVNNPNGNAITVNRANVFTEAEYKVYQSGLKSFSSPKDNANLTTSNSVNTNAPALQETAKTTQDMAINTPSINNVDENPTVVNQYETDPTFDSFANPLLNPIVESKPIQDLAEKQALVDAKLRERAQNVPPLTRDSVSLISPTTTQNVSNNNNSVKTRIANAVDKVKSGLGKDLLNNPNFQVMTHSELEQTHGVKRNSNRLGAVIGEGANSKIVIVSDNINENTTDEELVGLVHHEVAVHANELGKSRPEFDAILKTVERLSKVEGSNMKKASEKVPKNTNPKFILEEILAYFIENNPKSLLAKNYLTQFKMFVKDSFKKLGFTDGYIGKWANSITEKELIVMAQRSLKDYVKRNNTSNNDGKSVRDSILTPTQKQTELEGKAKFGDGAFTDAKLTTTLTEKQLNTRWNAFNTVINAINKNNTLFSEEFVRKTSDRYLPYEVLVKMTEKFLGKKVDDSLRVDQLQNLSERKGLDATTKVEEKWNAPLIEMLKKANIDLKTAERIVTAFQAPTVNEALKKANPNMQDNVALSGMTTLNALQIQNQYKNNADVMKIVDHVKAMALEIHTARLEAGLDTKEVFDKRVKDIGSIAPMTQEGNKIIDGVPGGTKGNKLGSVDIISTTVGELKRIAGTKETNVVGEAMNKLIQAINDKGDTSIGYVISMDPTHNIDSNGDKTNKFISKRFNKDAKQFEYKPMFNPGSNQNVYEYKQNGFSTFIVMNPESELAMKVARCLKSTDVVEGKGVVNQLANAMAPTTRVLSQLQTQFNPAFGPWNGLIDVMTVGLTVQNTPMKGMGTEIMLNALKSLPSLWKALRNEQKGIADNSPIALKLKAYRESGAPTGFNDQFTTAATFAKQISKALSNKKSDQLIEPIKNLVEAWNNMFEFATRISVFNASLSTGSTVQQAAMHSKDMSANFSRRGADIGVMAKLYSFFNAAIAGISTFAKTMFVRDPQSISGVRLTNAGKSIIGGGVVLGMMQPLMLMAAGYDEEDLKQFEKDSSWIIPVGDTPIKVPMPRIFNIFPAFGRAISESIIYGKPLQRAENFISIVIGSLNPLGNTSGLQMMAPTFLDYPVSIMENKDMSGNAIANLDRNPNQPTAGYLRSKDGASAVSKSMAEIVDYMTGGLGTGVPGLISPTGDQIDAGFAFLFGGPGREISKISQFAKSVNDGETNVQKIPLVGKIIGSTSSKPAQKSQYQENVRRVSEFETRINVLKDKNDSAGIEKLYKDEKLARLVPVMGTIEKRVASLNKNKRLLEKNGGSDSDIKQIDDGIFTLQQNFNKLVKKVNNDGN